MHNYGRNQMKRQVNKLNQLYKYFTQLMSI